jgi:N-acyl homoserine lactone hydrolase
MAIAFITGVTLLYTPGHTIGHQSVMIDLPDSNPIILALDAADLQENLDEELIAFPWSSARDAWLSIRKLKVLAEVRKATIFPGHDIEFYKNKMKKSPDKYE